MRRKSKKRGKTKRKQSGGVNPGNIITNENKNKYLGRLVKIKTLIPNNKTDEYGMYFLQGFADNNNIFRIMTPFRGDLDGYDNSVILKPIKLYGLFDRENILIKVPNTIDNLDSNIFPNLVELVTGSGLSKSMEPNNILTRGRMRTRKRQLALTEHPVETHVLPIDSHKRSINPRPLNSSVILNTNDGPITVDVPIELMELISSYVR